MPVCTPVQSGQSKAAPNERACFMLDHRQGALNTVKNTAYQTRCQFYRQWQPSIVNWHTWR